MFKSAVWVFLVVRSVWFEGEFDCPVGLLGCQVCLSGLLSFEVALIVMFDCGSDSQVSLFRQSYFSGQSYFRSYFRSYFGYDSLQVCFIFLLHG